MLLIFCSLWYFSYVVNFIGSCVGGFPVLCGIFNNVRHLILAALSCLALKKFHFVETGILPFMMQNMKT
jgi:hypothetical protein